MQDSNSGSYPDNYSGSYYGGQVHYEPEAVRFFDIAHEGAQLRAVAQAAGRLAGLGGAEARSVVVLATAQIAEAAARCAVNLFEPLRLPVVVARTLPGFIGPLDVVVVVGDAPDAETVTREMSTAARRGATVVLAGPQDGPVVEDALSDVITVPTPPTTLGASPLRTLGAVGAVLAGQEAAERLEALAAEVDDELTQLSPERELPVNLARQLRDFVAGARIIHTGYTPAGAAVAQLVSALWSARGLPGGFVSREELPAALADEAPQKTDDIFYDPFIDGPAAGVPVKTIVWGSREAQVPGARAEYAVSERDDEFAEAARLIVRGYAATALADSEAVG